MNKSEGSFYLPEPPKCEIVESSQYLKTHQYLNLKKFHSLDIEWHDNIETIKNSHEYVNIILGHEYLDALPFRAFKLVKKDDWKEIIIKNEVTKFCYDLSNSDPENDILLNNLEIYKLKVPIGSIIELSPDSIKTVNYVADNLLNKPLDIALFIDYDKNYPLIYRSTFRVFAFYIMFRDIKIID